MSSTPSSADRLSFTLFIAIAVHAMLIFGISFTLKGNDKIAPTLNITLATHRSKQAPEKADFLAQENQEASGASDKIKELTTTEFTQVSDVRIQEVNPLSAQQKTKPAPAQKQKIITTKTSSRRQASQPESDTQQEMSPEHDSDNTLEQTPTQKLASLQAKLALQRQAMARRPRVTRHTSVSTKSSDEAAYYNEWSNKIIRVGNKNFPKDALKKEIFGNLRLSVKIRSDGTVVNIEILESSGHTLLDDSARRIVRLAEPFAPFPPEIKRNTDIFEIIRTWKFEITGLSTEN